MIIILNRPAHEAWKVFTPYHGLDLGIKLGWYDYKTFDVVEY